MTSDNLSIEMWTLIATFVGIGIFAFVFRKEFNNKPRLEPKAGRKWGWLLFPIIGLLGTIYKTTPNLFLTFNSWREGKLILPETLASASGVELALMSQFYFGLLIVFSAGSLLCSIFLFRKWAKLNALFHYPVLILAIWMDYWANGVFVARFPSLHRVAISTPVKVSFFAIAFCLYFVTSALFNERTHYAKIVSEAAE